MSEPWPPAFMRTAPPTEPGTPTAHSKPVRPAAAVRRATTGSAAAPPAPHGRAVDVDRRRSPRPARRPARRSRRRPRAGSSPADHEHGRRPARRRPASADRRARSASSARPRRAARPAPPTAVGGARPERRVAARARSPSAEPGSRARSATGADGAHRSRRSGQRRGASSGSVVMSPAPSGQAEVAGAQLGREVGAATSARSGSQATRFHGWASSTASTSELAGDARRGRLAGGVDRR